jgi:hypothetical protein
VELDRRDWLVEVQNATSGLEGSKIAAHRRVRVGVPVLVRPGSELDVIMMQKRPPYGDGVSVENFDADPTLALQVDSTLKLRGALRRGCKQEISDLSELDINSREALEVSILRDTQLGEADQRLQTELVPDPAGGLGGAPRASHRGLFKHDDAQAAVSREQVIPGAEPDDSRPYDDNVCMFHDGSYDGSGVWDVPRQAAYDNR